MKNRNILKYKAPPLKPIKNFCKLCGTIKTRKIIISGNEILICNNCIIMKGKKVFYNTKAKRYGYNDTANVDAIFT